MAHSCNDLVDNKRSLIILWAIPSVLVFATLVLPMPLLVKGAICTFSLLGMGGACLYNAQHCRRLHCFITSPYFIFLSLFSAYLTIQPNSIPLLSWATFYLLFFIGSPLLIWLPEKIWGKYRS